MNRIEYYWDACKLYACKHCTYTLTGLRQVLPEALESVKPSLIFKHWRRTRRIIQAYRDGATFGDKQHKERVYKSHRRFSLRQLEADLG